MKTKSKDLWTKNGYDPRWLAPINGALKDRGVPLQITDLTEEQWDQFLGRLLDHIEERGACDTAHRLTTREHRRQREGDVLEDIHRSMQKVTDPGADHVIHTTVGRDLYLEIQVNGQRYRVRVEEQT